MGSLPNFEVVRAVSTTVRAKAADGGGMPLMEVRFSAFGEWYEIDSMWEGNFLERVDRGAFAKTIEESREQVKVLFNHGFDPAIGQKVLGQIESLSEEKDSPVGLVRLFDASYVRDLVPGLEAGVYGSSFRMKVTRDEVNKSPERSDHNPKGLPERTIKEAQLYEFGPVTFPAFEGASAKLRSISDRYHDLSTLTPHAANAPVEASAAPTTPDADSAHLGSTSRERRLTALRLRGVTP